MDDWSDLPDLLARLKAEVEKRPVDFDARAVRGLVDELIERIKGADDLIPTPSAEEAMRRLRGRRLFGEMERLGEALVQSGLDDPVVRTLHAQSLIDGQKLAAAAPLLEVVAADAQTPKARSEAHGLLGRLFKQRYVADRGSLARRTPFLQRSFREYAAGEAVGHDPLWHGINLVAVAARARRDGVTVPDASFDEKAHARKLIERSRAVAQDLWVAATRMEAHVALEEWDDALKEAKAYVGDTATDGFAVAGTLRQLQEVWQLSPMTSGGHQPLLALLNSEVLVRERGELMLQSADVRALQRNFDNELGHDIDWFQTGLRRCEAVARIQTEAGHSVGTAFLVDGHDFGLKPDGDPPLLLTNWHVVSVDGRFPGSLPPRAAVVVFEASNQKRRIKCVVAYSMKLDATFLEIDPPLDAPPSPCPLTPPPPDFDENANPPQRVYVIGHPNGRRLTFSLHDSYWLDSDGTTLHYRTPTDPGSSGSPVFDQQNWSLIGLHHAGSKTMNRLRGKPGTYEANEGHSISAINAAVRANRKP